MHQGNWNQNFEISDPEILNFLEEKTKKSTTKQSNKAVESKINQSEKQLNNVTCTPGKLVQNKDKELLEIMTSKLQTNEKIIASYRKEIKEKTLLIEFLQQKVKDLQISDNSNLLQKVQKLELKNKALIYELTEIKQFLLDYGVQWQNHQATGELDIQAIQKNEMRMYQLPSEIDINVIKKRVEELNIIAYQDNQVISKQKGRAQFISLTPIPIAFFKNGIFLKGSSFKNYKDSGAQSVLSDILDGYFPYELKQQYPEGVPLEVHDLTETTFGAKTYTKEVQCVLDQITRQDKIQQNQIPIQLNQSNESSNVIQIKTHVDQNPSNKQYTTLRIKTETGKKQLIIKLLYEDTLETLRQILDQNRETEKLYQIRSVFPSKLYEENSKTMLQLGLIPNYTLFLQIS